MTRTYKRSTLLTLVAAAALALVASPAFAGGPLALCASGQAFLWPAGGANIPFNPDQGDLGPLTNAAAVAEVQASFDTWAAVASSTASYTNAGALPVDVDITNFGPYLNAVAPDGLSAIVFDDTGEIFDLLFGPGSGVLGFAGPEWGNTITCEIFEGLSFLNGPAFTNATAARDVMVHEFGHYTNFAHTAVNGQIFLGDTSGPTPDNTFGLPVITDVETMYPFYFGPGSGTQSLGADDIAILSTMYPAAGFFAATGTITGTIFSPNGSTKLTGVNVIARNLADPFGDAVSALSSDFSGDFSQGDPFTGVYTLNGLTPGADYAVFVDEILAGGFSTPPLVPLPGPEEFHTGAAESNSDDPLVFTAVTAAAGSPATGVDVIFNSPQPGDILPVGDDGSVQLPLPFNFCLCGQSFDSVFVNANGNLTFGAPSGDFSESVPELLAGPPRIAGLWDDLNPNTGGFVTFDQTAATFTAIWSGVPEFFATGANSFTITLEAAGQSCGEGAQPNGNSGEVGIDYGDLSARDGIAGVSCGGAVTSRFETESDLSSFGSEKIKLFPKNAAAFEQFSALDNDLGGTSNRYDNVGKAFKDKFEDNDTLGKAKQVALPFDTSNTQKDFSEIRPAGGDVDYFKLKGLEGGQTLVAEVLTGQIDSVLGVFDLATGTLLAVDDDGGAGFLSRLVFEIPADGDYALAVSTFPDFDFSGDGNLDGVFGQGRYVLDAFAIDGVLLDLGDDDFEEVALGFGFPFQGTTYNSVFVNSNGSLTFGSGDTDFSESVAEFLNDQPRIAALWDDLSPNQGGTVIVSGDAAELTVAFMGVPEFFAGNSNNFAVTLEPSGRITIAYGAVAAADGLVGVTPGGGAANPGATDLSAAASLSAVGTTYELFTFGSPFDLDGATLVFDP